VKSTLRLVGMALVVLAVFGAGWLAGRRGEASFATPPTPPADAAAAVPAAVDGWREYPLRDGVIVIHPAKARRDIVDVKVPAGKGLEYKLTMKKGDTLVYNVDYGSADPAKMISEFHGHTPQVDGVGDLMFYSKTGGSPQSGAFTAPWDGIHGWYLKNDGAEDAVVKLELAGFYELETQ
jgi:hypothetical protein